MKQLNNLLQLSFLKSSSIVFVVNIFVGLLNYALITLVSRMLSDEYSLWTAMTGLLAILMTPTSGIFIEYTKKVSIYAKETIHASLGYYDVVTKAVRPLLYASVVLSICLGGIALSAQVFSVSHIMYIPVYESVIVLGLVAYLLLNINTNMRQQFMLGMLDIKDYSILTLTTNIVRFVPTLLLLSAGLKVYALPLGLLISSVFGLLFGQKLVHKFYIERRNTPNETGETHYNIIQDFYNGIKNIIGLFFVLTFFNISSIISNWYLPADAKDLFAVFFNFGQIIHFGAVAFMGVLVAFAARGKNMKVYLMSLGVVAFLTVIIGFAFENAGDVLLALFNRSQYIDLIPLIVWYSVFIACYNMLFVSVQYLISHSEYKKLYALVPFLGLLIAGQIAIAKQWLSFSHSLLQDFITVSVCVGAAAALYFVIITLTFHRK